MLLCNTWGRRRGCSSPSAPPGTETVTVKAHLRGGLWSDHVIGFTAGQISRSAALRPQE